MTPVYIIGGGGHAKVLIDILVQRSIVPVAVLDNDSELIGKMISGIKILGNDDYMDSVQPDTVSLVNGLGSIASSALRKKIFEKFKSSGYSFFTVTHLSAIISSHVILSEGSQVMAGAVIQTGSRIGINSIINSGAIIDHDALIGDHSHIAPGVTLSGNVTIGDSSHIGTGASVIQGIKIGRNCLVGAGSVILKDIPDGMKAYGNPARVVGRL